MPHPPLPLPFFKVLNQEVLPAEFSVVSKVVNPLPVQEVSRVERVVRGVPYESDNTIQHSTERRKASIFQLYRQGSEGGEPRRNPYSRSTYVSSQ